MFLVLGMIHRYMYSCDAINIHGILRNQICQDTVSTGFYCSNPIQYFPDFNVYHPDQGFQCDSSGELPGFSERTGRKRKGRGCPDGFVQSLHLIVPIF